MPNRPRFDEGCGCFADARIIHRFHFHRRSPMFSSADDRNLYNARLICFRKRQGKVWRCRQLTILSLLSQLCSSLVSPRTLDRSLVPASQPHRQLIATARKTKRPKVLFFDDTLLSRSGKMSAIELRARKVKWSIPSQHCSLTKRQFEGTRQPGLCPRISDLANKQVRAYSSQPTQSSDGYRNTASPTLFGLLNRRIKRQPWLGSLAPRKGNNGRKGRHRGAGTSTVAYMQSLMF